VITTGLLINRLTAQPTTLYILRSFSARNLPLVRQTERAGPIPYRITAPTEGS
jgi:hypothetical protein